MKLMLATAVGDAYGASFEYCDTTPERPNALRYVQNTTHRSLKPGHYTDDTQMAIAVLECILSGKLEVIDFANSFVGTFQRDPRIGYSRQMQAFIETCQDGRDMLARIHPDSAKSGAAMRSGPLALLPDVLTIKFFANRQARITHNTAGGSISSIAVGLAGFALRTGLCNRVELPVWLTREMGFDWTQPWTQSVGSAGLDSVKAAIYLVSQHSQYDDLLKAGVDLTGDVDTVLAVACGLLSWTNPAPLPITLVDGLENGAYGRDFLMELDSKF